MRPLRGLVIAITLLAIAGVLVCFGIDRFVLSVVGLMVAAAFVVLLVI